METYENNGLDPQQENSEMPTTEPAVQPQSEPIPPAEPATEPQPEPIPEPIPQAEPAAQPQSTYYHGAGAGRREDTYSSAYTAYHTPQQPQGGYQPPYYQPPYYQQPYYQPPKPPKKEKKKGQGTFKSVVAAILVIVLVLGGCLTTALVTTGYWKDQNDQLRLYFNEKLALMQQQLDNKLSGTTPGGTPVAPVVPGDAMSPSQVYAQCVNSVVAVYCSYNAGGSSGSGFILTEDGYMVTNYHVVEGASRITVTTYDAQEFEAKLIGYDATNDIALLKAEASGLRAATIGSSDALAIGDQVVAIGNPLGELAATLTVGYVSAKDRDVNTDGTVINMLQTDAAINPGNSGGPLFNMYGQVIGITTAKYSGTTDSGASIEGIGFAIPIDDVIGMLEDLRNFGYVTGAYLGVSVREVDPAAQAYGVPAGAYVDKVVQGNCAAEAGVRAKDIIIELGGHKIASINDLTRALRHFKAGDTSTITVWRSGQEIVLTITFDEKPASVG